MSEKNKKLRIVLSVILLAVLFVCVFWCIRYFSREKQAEQAYGELRDEAVTVRSAEASGTEAAGERTVYEGLPEVDFDALWETNEDICAWITVPGTQTDDPVLRNGKSENPYDNYYLQHTVEHAEGLPGAIYMQPVNSGDFTDGNTVLYGHNMKKGTMFGSLHQFKDDTFFHEHEYVYVVTPEKNLIYRIFAVVEYSDMNLMGMYDFDNKESYEEFLASLKENRSMGDLFREETEVTAEDRIVTLSTCIKGQDDKRLLVEAVLIDEYER